MATLVEVLTDRVTSNYTHTLNRLTEKLAKKGSKKHGSNKEHETYLSCTEI